MGRLLFLSRNDLESLLKLNDVIAVVEEGFLSLYRGDAVAYPVVREPLEKYEGIFGVKSGFVKAKNFLGFKAGGYWKDNPKRGIPAHQSLIVLYDPETGVPQAVMDGNFITIIRTGAVGAIASRHLARQHSGVAAVVGCGIQGRIQLEALRTNFTLRDIRCYDSDPKIAERYAQDMSTDNSTVKCFLQLENAVKGADIIVTTTPSTKPVVLASWVGKGAHINAIGADTKGKQEIDPRLYQRSKVVVDDIKQCQELGETQHNLDFVKSRGVYAELGEILSGEKPGREYEEEITLFDATGIAFQDLVTAGLAMGRAVDQGVGTRITL
jgi:alanine dehydrogenase